MYLLYTDSFVLNRPKVTSVPFYRCVHASLYEGLFVHPSVGQPVHPSMVRPLRVFFFESRILSENDIEMIESVKICFITCALTIEKNFTKILKNLKVSLTLSLDASLFERTCLYGPQVADKNLKITCPFK